MTLQQQNTELQQRIMELMRENRFLKNEFIAVKSSLGTIKESTEATHQIIVDLEQQNAELLRQNAELAAQIERIKGAAHYLAYAMDNQDSPTRSPAVPIKAAIAARQRVCIEAQCQSLEALKKQWMDEMLAKIESTKSYGGSK